MTDLRVSSSGQAMAGSIEQGSAPSAADSLTSIIEILQGISAPLQTGTAQNKGSNVSNANGAPQLAASTRDFSSDSLMLALADAQQKTQQAQVNTLRTGITADAKTKEIQTKRSIEKIKEWGSAFRKAAAKAGGVLGWVKKIFTAVAAVFAVVATAIATVATGGAATPLLAMATLALASTALTIASDIDKAKGGTGFDNVVQWMDPGSLLGKGMGELSKLMGASDADAAIVSATFAVAGTIAIVAATVVLSGGAATGTAADAITKTISSAARIGQTVAGAASGATQIAQGAVNMVVATDQRTADLILAAQKAITVLVAKVQHQMEEGIEDLKKAMNNLAESITVFSDIIRANSQSFTQITVNLAGKGQTI